MAIKIIDEGDTVVTAGELARYRREWEKVCSYNTEPPTLEDFVRRRMNDEWHRD